jgi:hypothetical protein
MLHKRGRTRMREPAHTTPMARHSLPCRLSSPGGGHENGGDEAGAGVGVESLLMEDVLPADTGREGAAAKMR